MYWRPDLYVQTVMLQHAGAHAASVALFEPERWPGAVSAAVERGRRHLLFRAASATFQLVTDEALANGAPLAVVMSADRSFDLRISAAQDFLRVVARRGERRRAARSHRAARLLGALSAYDIWRAAGSYRAVAERKFGAARVASEPWKTSALRGAAIRVVRLGQALVGGGYRGLLQRPDG